MAWGSERQEANLATSSWTLEGAVLQFLGCFLQTMGTLFATDLRFGGLTTIPR